MSFAGSAGDAVVAAVAGDPVGARLAVDRVVAPPAGDLVVAGAAVELVVALVAVDVVAAIQRVDLVRAAATEDGIVAGRADQPLGVTRPADRLARGRRVVGCLGGNGNDVLAAAQDVARRGVGLDVDGVDAVAAVDGVGAVVGGTDRVVADVAVDRVGAGAADQRVVAGLAQDLVVARSAVDAVVAVVLGDGGGRERTARRPVTGADKVARFLLGLQQRYGAARLAAAATPVLVNGDLGLLFPAFPGDGAQPPLGRRVSCFAVRGGRIAAVYDVANPDKLTRVPG